MTEATATRVEARALVATARLTGTAFLALAVLYLVGLDQGATSIFGSDTHIHEFVHDARHLLGFPCH
ncbi:CbtB-domain containing protein [Mycobacterium sp. 1164985.4]|uniref:CbtB domain-containing protein n=1 Tax=Mycobacterium sp. 1164985.4 TaxID=1834069 RepID=UPI0007FD1C06|nr:CbtB-domain containing protein [Mycobacterium sp. 1164985.4]OBK80221.1 cobalt transporter [Mycobacterium sp. 1164985.4]